MVFATQLDQRRDSQGTVEVNVEIGLRQIFEKAFGYLRHIRPAQWGFLDRVGLGRLTVSGSWGELVAGDGGESCGNAGRAQQPGVFAHAWTRVCSAIRGIVRLRRRGYNPSAADIKTAVRRAHLQAVLLPS